MKTVIEKYLENEPMDIWEISELMKTTTDQAVIAWCEMCWNEYECYND